MLKKCRESCKTLLLALGWYFTQDSFTPIIEKSTDFQKKVEKFYPVPKNRCTFARHYKKEAFTTAKKL